MTIPDLALNAEKAPYLTMFVNAVKAGGSLEDFGNFGKVATVYARYAANPDIAAAMARGSRALTTLRAAAVTSWGGALSGLVGSGGELDNAGGPVFRLHIPLISGGWDWVESHATHALPGCRMVPAGGG